jgi:hypothetical protein
MIVIFLFEQKISIFDKIEQKNPFQIELLRSKPLILNQFQLKRNKISKKRAYANCPHAKAVMQV